MIHAPIDTSGYSKGARWCVPTAVSLLTGAPLRETTERFAFMRRESYADIEGVWPEEMILLLGEHGYRAEAIDLPARYPDLKAGPTIGRFMRERVGVERVMPLAFEVWGHMMTAHFDMVFDTSHPTGCHVSRIAKPKRTVLRAWIIHKR